MKTPDVQLPRGFWVLALLLAGLMLATLGIRPLFNPDEGRYVDIPQEMLASHDFIVPHLNGVVYLEKPPLQYWLTALTLQVLGPTELGGRLILGLAWLGIGWVVYRLSVRLYAPERAVYAVAMALSGLLIQLMSTLLTLDLSLSFWLLLAVLSLCEAQWWRQRLSDPAQSGHTPAHGRVLSRRWMWACYAAMAGATLTKGLIGVVLPGLGLLLYTALQRDLKLWRHLHLVSGLSLYAALTVPWFWAVEHHHAGALQFLIIHEHFQRYLTTIHERYRPIWYFFALLLPALLPWCAQGLRALVSMGVSTGPKHERDARFDAKRLLWAMSVVILVFYSFSDSKLPPYILPMMPLLAVLAAGHPVSTLSTDLRISHGLVGLLGLALVVFGIWQPLLNPGADQQLMVTRLAPWLLSFGVVLLVVVGVSHLALRRSQWLTASLILSGGFLLTGIGLFHVGAASISYRYSAKELLSHAPPIDPTAPVYSVTTFDWTLPVYLKHTVIPVAWRGELDYGLTDQPKAARESLEIFQQEWQNLPQGYALIPRAVHNQLQQAGLPMSVQAYDFDNVWVSRRDTPPHE